ncbi:hypothetical protein GCM10007291_04550 [Gemmobacter nanjingensis]|uniref:Uncharacterized protein n=1 Tax=Gemmobacter nanjingensis TaxID=488454 RepID=A0ABQ3F7A6_9RHOB|nr:hypothetical protein GCM10007291_04550 [Gemmobacter nanjingensis]
MFAPVAGWQKVCTVTAAQGPVRLPTRDCGGGGCKTLASRPALRYRNGMNARIRPFQLPRRRRNRV